MTTEPIRRLRTLQDVLGQLNDLDVQQSMLRALAHEVAGSSSRMHRTDRTVQILIQTFENQKGELQAEVHTPFTDFIAEVAPWA